MKTLKKLSLMLLISGFAFTMNAQETPQKHVCTKECRKSCKKAHKLKKHVCTEACHTSGKHVYKHGEKRHVCDASCKM
ncbi:MAG: hypothetical protein ACK4HC_05745 [Cloacibacterium sp.]|jgi:hypothetical protein